MKNYKNYTLILEKNRIEQIKDKYSEKVPLEIIDYFEKTTQHQIKRILNGY